ncbi:MAG: phenylalanine--tRNA ligase subunit alpha, partial [Bacteroidota bacterium]
MKEEEEIKTLISEVESFKAESKEQLENFRLKFLSKKGILGDLFSKMKEIEPALRKDYGKWVNELKVKAEEKLSVFKDSFQGEQKAKEETDLSLPGEPIPLGSLHPLTIIRNKIVAIFNHIGYTVSEGPEIEDDWHNFTALNLPENHPARDMQDTFFIES